MHDFPRTWYLRVCELWTTFAGRGLLPAVQWDSAALMRLHTLMVPQERRCSN